MPWNCASSVVSAKLGERSISKEGEKAWLVDFVCGMYVGVGGRCAEAESLGIAPAWVVSVRLQGGVGGVEGKVQQSS